MSFVHLSNVRLSFPHLVEPQPNRDDPTKPPSYSADLILSETSADWVKLMQTCASVAREKFKEEFQVAIGLIQAKTKLRCYGSGAEKINSKTGEVYAGYAGNVFIATKTSKDRNTEIYSKPQVADASGKGIDVSNTMLYRDLTSEMYAGCRVNVVVKPWVQDNKHGRAIRCELVGIQFAGDDEPFGAPEADLTNFFGAVATAPASAAPAMGLPPFMMPK